MAKASHILGVVLGFLAAIAGIVYGIATAADPKADATAPGKFIVMGIALLIGAVVATIDGARAFPQIGIWRIGGKWEGLSDLAVLIIVGVVGLGFGLTFAFN